MSRHYAPGAVLYHYLLAAHTAEDVYRVYRSYAASALGWGGLGGEGLGGGVNTSPN
mgnify:CR=1 FL=1